MQVRVFTLRYNPTTEAFEDAAVTQFLADKEVCSIRDHFASTIWRWTSPRT